MKKVLSTFIWLVLLITTVSPAGAQTVDPSAPSQVPARTIPIALHPAPDLDYLVADTAERAAELKRWMDDFLEWRDWSARWANRREPGLFSGHRDRRQKPDPPVWLAHRCETVIDDDPLVNACSLLAEWNMDSLTLQARARVTVTTNSEQLDKTVFWEHIHVDVLWPAMQWQSSVYGIIGMHTATTVGRRLQVFTSPGVMLLNLPTTYGSRTWKVAANYGIGYRLFDFNFPGDRPASLHFNLAKAWLISDVSDVAVGRSTDFVGFSVTFRRR